MTVADLIIELTGVELNPREHPYIGLKRRVMVEVFDAGGEPRRHNISDLVYDSEKDETVLKVEE